MKVLAKTTLRNKQYEYRRCHECDETHHVLFGDEFSQQTTHLRPQPHTTH